MHASIPSRWLRTALVAVAVSTLAACAGMPTESAETVLNRANAAMGGAGLRSISYSGSGTGATFGQAYEPGAAWPRIAYSSFSRVADYGNAAFREDAARSRAEPTGGGAIPLMGLGEQRTSGLLRGDVAWNIVGTTPNAVPLAAHARIHDLWTTPHGVIKAALANNASVTTRKQGGRSLTAVSFAVPGRFRATALVNAAGLVEQIESVQPNAVMGDTAAVIRFSDYRDIGGVRFPMRIQQELGGFPVLDLTVKEVIVNPVAGIEVPAAVTTWSERVTADKVAEGVWFMAGGSHNSVAIEMKDHLMLIESPLFDGRALPLLAEVRKLANGKPISLVVNSHHHFDHSGGLRAAIAEGATIVTSETARPYFEKTFSNPNRISPDALEKSGRKAVVSGVNGKRVFSDGSRVVEVYFIEGSPHAEGFMMVYLPREKILVEADAYTPSPPNAPAPAQPNELTVNLVQNMERLNLRPEQILPLHGRMVPVTELYKAAGRR